MTTVIDASSLIILAKTNTLEIAWTIYGPISVTDAVYDEVVAAGKRRSSVDAWQVEAAISRGWFAPTSLTLSEKSLARHLLANYPALGKGECEALACAETRNWLLIIEERKAKALARLRGIRYTIARTIPLEGYLAGKLSYADALSLMQNVGVAMNTDLAVLNALNLALKAIEDERGRKGP
ncbi:MAG: hypothetical protein AB1791_02440 [Chloroflexota bacterium]